MRARVMLGLVLSTLAAALWSSGDASAQTVRWNDRGLAADTTDEAPTVQLWLEGARSYSYGQPARVWFNVSDDAYVIVARVDGNGHLTVLYPAGRTRSTEVKGGEDIQVRGRRGAAGASFYATDRMGGGFVFAIASYDPFDLSRLGIRDFDRYVTGTYVGRPTRVYIGDPHRVITRFAAMVTYQEHTPFDYAVDYYNVDAPYYLTSTGFSNFCFGFNGMSRRGLQERWDDELFYGGGSGAMGWGGTCSNLSAMCGALGYFNSPWGYDMLGWNSLGPLCFLPRGPQGNVPQPPIGPPGGDSVRVGPWLPDSIRGAGPDTVGVIPEGRSSELIPPDGLRRQNTVTEGPRRPIVMADDPSDKSYSIPGRALRNTPTTLGEGRERDIGGSPRPGRDRISPVSERDNGGGIDWVRPPRQVTGDTRTDYGEGRLPRNPRERGSDRATGDDFRGSRPTFVSGREPRDMPPRYDRPSRTYGPRFDMPSPNVRNSFDGPRYDSPPPRFDGPRFNGGSYSPPFGGAGSPGPSTHSGGQIHAPATSAPPAATQAPVAPPAPPASGSSSSGERKPGK